MMSSFPIRYFPIAPLALLLMICGGPAQAQSDEKQVEVDTVVVSPAPRNNENNAAELWDKTKEKTGEAATTAAEFSKVQGKKILKGTKQGVEKGTEVVVDGSKKAWSATKSATKKAAQATGTALEKTGAAISEAVEGRDQNAPVTERSLD